MDIEADPIVLNLPAAMLAQLDALIANPWHWDTEAVTRPTTFEVE